MDRPQAAHPSELLLKLYTLELVTYLLGLLQAVDPVVDVCHPSINVVDLRVNVYYFAIQVVNLLVKSIDLALDPIENFHVLIVLFSVSIIEPLQEPHKRPTDDCYNDKANRVLHDSLSRRSFVRGLRLRAKEDTDFGVLGL